MYYLPILINKERIYVCRLDDDSQGSNRNQVDSEFIVSLRNAERTSCEILRIKQGTILKSYKKNQADHDYDVFGQGSNINKSFGLKTVDGGIELVLISSEEKGLNAASFQVHNEIELDNRQFELKIVRGDLVLYYSNVDETLKPLIGAPLKIWVSHLDGDINYSSNLRINIIEKKYVNEFVFDFGSEASQFYFKKAVGGARDEELPGGIAPIFPNAMSVFGNNKDENDVIQKDSSNLLYQSKFFIKNNLNLNSTEYNSEVVTLNTYSELAQSDDDLIPLGNAKIIEQLHEEEVATIIVDEMNVSITQRINEISKKLLTHFYKIFISQLGQNKRFIQLTLLVPNIYDQSRISSLINSTRIYFKTELSALGYTNALIDIRILSESDASFLAVDANTTGNYLLVDIGKGTTDISLLKKSPDNIESLLRMGFAGAGNILTFAYLQTILFQMLGGNKSNNGTTSFTEENNSKQNKNNEITNEINKKKEELKGIKGNIKKSKEQIFKFDEQINDSNDIDLSAEVRGREEINVLLEKYLRNAAILTNEIKELQNQLEKDNNSNNEVSLIEDKVQKFIRDFVSKDARSKDRIMRVVERIKVNEGEKGENKNILSIKDVRVVNTLDMEALNVLFEIIPTNFKLKDSEGFIANACDLLANRIKESVHGITHGNKDLKISHLILTGRATLHNILRTKVIEKFNAVNENIETVNISNTNLKTSAISGVARRDDFIYSEGIGSFHLIQPNEQNVKIENNESFLYRGIRITRKSHKWNILNRLISYCYEQINPTVQKLNKIPKWITSLLNWMYKFTIQDSLEYKFTNGSHILVKDKDLESGSILSIDFVNDKGYTFRSFDKDKKFLGYAKASLEPLTSKNINDSFARWSLFPFVLKPDKLKLMGPIKPKTPIPNAAK